VIALAALAAVLAVAAPKPAAPTVTGPRDTTLLRPVYVFRARGAIAFRCAFDSTTLHPCGRRYSEPLDPGAHTLRVRSVGRRHTVSRVVAIRIRVRFPVPELRLRAPVSVGAGAGVPAPNTNGVWVPVTSDGTLALVRDGAVTSRVTVGAPASTSGLLDSALADDRRSIERAIWSASDGGAGIARVDPATGTVTARVDVAPRPGGLTGNERSLWAFHFLQGVVTRIDLATAAATRFEVREAQATGILWREGSLWLLTTQPSRVLELDPATGAVRRSIDLQPPSTRRHSVVDTWWLASAGGAVWATLPNYDTVVRIDPATGEARYVRIAYGVPFGIAAFAGGSVLVATDHALLRLDGTTGAMQAAASIPRASRTGFVSLAFGFGSAWLTNYDRGTLTEVPSAPPRNAR
jgi:streptogramin lyase